MDSKLIVFGSTGDLVKTKVMPALQALGVTPFLHGRKDGVDKNYIKSELHEIADQIKHLDLHHAYVALPPQHYEMVLRELARLPHAPRIALEKPFGTSLNEAEKLIRIIHELKLEQNIYLVDHYLGKPALISPPKLEAEHIEKMEIDIFETQNVAQRGAFYDAVGTIGDFVQNHILAIIWRLMGELSHVSYKDGTLLLGQYEGFTKTSGVDTQSKTETYVSLEYVYDTLFTIRVRVGKALARGEGVVRIMYKDDSRKEIIIKSPVNSYEAILADFLNGGSKFSLSFEDAKQCWKITEKILEAKKHLAPIIYPQGADPDTII